MDLTHRKKLVYYGGNYTTYVRTKSENEVNQMKAYAKQQEEIAHIKSEHHGPFVATLTFRRVHCQCWYLRELGQTSQVQAKDHRQDGGCWSY